MYKNIDNCTYFHHKINFVRPTNMTYRSSTTRL